MPVLVWLATIPFGLPATWVGGGALLGIGLPYMGWLVGRRSG
jgi:hypothetical protein